MGSSFSPLSISGLVAWYDFSDATTLYTDTGLTSLVAADGNSIKGVKDKTASAMNLTEATNAPLYKVAIQNGKSAALFNGTSSILTKTSFSPLNGLATFSLYVACSPTAAALGKTIVNYGSSGSTNNFYFEKQATHKVDAFVNQTVTQEVRDGATTFSGANLVSITYDAAPASGELNLWLNGVQTSQTRVSDLDNSSTFSTATFYLGEFSAGSQFFADYLFEVLLFNTAHSTANRLAVQAYLRSKWATP